MKALLLEAANQLRFTELPSPPLEPNQVRLRVKNVGVCGSDYTSISGKLPFTRFPIVPGHEAAGEVTESASPSWKAGQRALIHPILADRREPLFQRGEVHHLDSTEVLGVVSRNGAYAEQVVIEDYMLRPMPDGLDFESAAMVEPVAVAVRALEQGRLQAGERVLIVGAGNIGLLLLQVAKAMGAGRVVVTDLVPAKLELARRLGADEALNTSSGFDAAAHEKQFDVVVDGAATEQTVRDALTCCSRGGRIVVYGVPKGDIVWPLKAAFAKDVTLSTSRLYGADFDLAIRLVSEGKVRVKETITHRVRLSDAPQLLSRIIEGQEAAIKVMIQP